MNIGDKILELRKSKGYSQEEVANKLNVSRQTISKWETNQSTPDFDKIVPLCQLFGITTDELLMNKQVTTLETSKEQLNNEMDLNALKLKNKKRFAISLCFSILIYFISVMWVIFAEYAKFDDDISVVVFLGLAGIATVIIVYASIINKDNRVEKEKQLKKDESPLVNSIIGILGLIFTVIYLLISFYTMAWHLTWILWIVYAIVCDIVKLIFQLEAKDE
jgi:transcriptional regulator with XRE-family HTH domain